MSQVKIGDLPLLHFFSAHFDLVFGIVDADTPAIGVKGSYGKDIGARRTADFQYTRLVGGRGSQAEQLRDALQQQGIGLGKRFAFIRYFVVSGGRRRMRS